MRDELKLKKPPFSRWLFFVRDREFAPGVTLVAASCLSRMKIRVGFPSRLGVSPGFSDRTVANAKTAHSEIQV